MDTPCVHRIYVVEDSEVMRLTLQMYLDRESDLEVVGLADSGESALEHLDTLTPDVVLVDVSLSGITGIDVTDQLSQSHPDLPVIILSGHAKPAYVRSARDAGASGYVMKGDPSTYVDAIRTVMDGDEFVSDPVAGLWKRDQTSSV